MSKKVLLFINGEPPKYLPKISDFKLIGCTDGAFDYLKEKGFPLDKLDFISGDFDSHFREEISYEDKFIHTPDQDKTDFHKALEIVLDKSEKGQEVWVFGASGKEQDHFLGNLNVAYLFKNQLNIRFFDEYSSYYFISNEIILENIKGKRVSLFPFPSAGGVFTKGLHWELKGENLSLTGKISTRNKADQDKVEITYRNGDLVLFIEK